MKAKASDICPKCKHCEGMVKDSFYLCGDSHSDGGLYHLIPVEDELYCTAYEEETNMNKVEGKAGEFCPKCKNCKAVVWKGISHIECEDPYDGLIRELICDDDIRCSMFEIKSEKKEEEPCDKISLLQHELEMDKLRRVILQLEKEKASHLKGIERLKKSQEKLQNQVKNLQTTNEESYKREEKLEDKCRKLERRLNEKVCRMKQIDCELILPLVQLLYPRENKIYKPYSEVIKDIKEFRDELTSLNTINKGLAEDRKKLINYIRSLKIASDNYLKEFTYEED